MKSAFYLLALVLLLARGAYAHPLGQLNANSVAEFRLGPQRLEVVYDVTFAMGATLTRLPQVDKNGDGTIDAAEEAAYVKLNAEHFQENLHLKLDGQDLKLSLGQCRLNNDTDKNGLPQLGVVVVLVAPWSVDAKEHSLLIEDKGFEGVGGWREIRVKSDGGIGVLSAPQPPQNAVEALQTRGEIKFHEGPTTWKSGTSATSQARKASDGDQSLLTRIADPNGGVQTVLLTLGLAFVLGALHALQPGHGKTVVGAYLIGSRGTVSHAILLGLVVTFTHTFSVILLGVVALFAFNTVVPEKLIPWLGFVSGLLVSTMGVILIKYRDTMFGHTHSHGHSHDHGPPPDGREVNLDAPRPYAGTVPIEEAGEKHRGAGYGAESPGPHPTPSAPAFQGGHSHEHMIPEKITLAGLISLGVSGGMVPCPDALVVLLGAIAMKKLALGLLVLLAFSAGLASVLMAVGILMVKASHLFAKRYPSQTTVKRITELSYLFIVFMGLFLAFQSLWSGGIIGPAKTP